MTFRSWRSSSTEWRTNWIISSQCLAPASTALTMQVRVSHLDDNTKHWAIDPQKMWPPSLLGRVYPPRMGWLKCFNSRPDSSPTTSVARGLQSLLPNWSPRPSALSWTITSCFVVAILKWWDDEWASFLLSFSKESLCYWRKANLHVEFTTLRVTCGH